MPEQLAFDLPARVSRSRGDFFVSGANRLAVARLEAPGTWPGGRLVLVGPEGAGKTHLAHVWAEARGAALLGPGDLAGLDVPGVGVPLVLDGADALPPEAEETLFHLHNHMGATGLELLLTARRPAARWRLALPDLKSRMEATDSVRIDAPDDALLRAVLVKLFADRQLAVGPPAIAWLLRNMERSFAEAQRLVAALDAAALSEGRAVTRRLAQQVVERLRDSPGEATGDG